MTYFDQSIESFCKFLYSGKVEKSKKFGSVESKVEKVSVVEETDKYVKYQIDTKLIYNDTNEEKESITFSVPQFNSTNLRQVSINIALINKRIKYYTKKNGDLVGASFKGIYIAPAKNKINLGKFTYSIDEVRQVIDMCNSGSEDAITAVMTKEKFDALKNFELSDKTYNKIVLILDDDNFKKTILDKHTFEILLEIASGKIKSEVINEVTPYDIEFFDYNKGLIYHFQGERASLRNKFYSQLNQHGRIYSKLIENSIKRYFLGNKAIINMIQYSQDTNPLSMASQSKKLYFLNADDLKKTRVNSKYMDGILDPVRTHENAKDINIYQELSLACEFNGDEGSKVKVYDKDFNEVMLDMTTYYNSNILSFECVDYKRKSIRLNKNGVYKYCHRTNYYETKDLSKIDYYRHEGTFLSYSTALMPMSTRNDLTRNLLQGHYNTQAIATIGSRKPIIYTSFKNEIYKNSQMNVKSKIKGTVVEISQNEDIIKVETGKDTDGKPLYDFINCGNKYNKTKNHTFNTYNPTVKVGDKIDEGTVVFAMNSFKDGELALSVPLLTTYSTLRGKEIEDGYVYSKSAVAKMSHKEVMNFTFKAKHGMYRFGENFVMRHVGDKIDLNDPIFVIEVKNEDKNIKDILGDNRTIFNETTYKLPAFSLMGEIKDIKIYMNPIMKVDTPEDVENKEKLTKWNNEILEPERKFYGSNLFFHKFPASKENNECDFLIEFSVEYYNSFKLSDKCTNRSSNKGVLTHIVPDEEMPITEDGRRIEVVMPALAMASRKNSFNITECKLTKLSKFLLERIHAGEFDKFKSVLSKLYTEVKPEDFNEKYILDKYEDDGFLRIEIDPFDAFMSDEDLDKLLDEVGIPNHGKEYLIDGVTGKRIRTPLLVGYNEYMRTHFIAENKGSATPEVAYTSKMVMGIGHNRKTGQKIGEQETHALMASGKEDFLVKSTFEENRKDIKITADFNNLLMRIKTRQIED